MEYMRDRDEWLPGGYPSRAMCDVLHELRETLKLHVHQNGPHMLGLIEEAQTIANRMESGLSNKRDYYALMKILRAKVKALRFPEGDKKDE